jgi:adenosylhomocysteine nucleosidase
MSPLLIVMALPLESQGVFERNGIEVLYTGVGKVNAAYALTRRLGDYRCRGLNLPHVVNFGTAGSQRLETGSLIECTAFIQRDMDVSGLGVPLGTTPFEDVPARLDAAALFDGLAKGVCASGDSFVMTACTHECDVLDMEAYALAKVCHFEGCRFNAAKYVTDGADHSASDHWQQNLRHAADLFVELYERIKAQ